METSDQALIAVFQSGDRRAGEQLVDRYYGRVLGFFLNKAPAAANDLAQRTFLGCFEGLGRLADPTRFRSFLFAIAHNQLRKYYRGRQREGEKLDFGSVSAVDLDPSPSSVIAERREQRILLEALRRIPLDYQIALELFYWEDMTAAEVAVTIEAPLGTVKTRIRRGRQLLEEAIAKLEDDPGSPRPSTTGLDSSKSNLDEWARSLRARVRGGRAG